MGTAAGCGRVTNVLKIDLHLHTAEDPLDRIDHDAHALIDRAAALGFDAIAITLHDRQLADARVDAHARERGIVLLRGIERTIGRKHVLLINFPPDCQRVNSFADAVALKETFPQGLVIAPHPPTEWMRRAGPGRRGTMKGCSTG